jgi:phosphatidate cytidylyltransferase
MLKTRVITAVVMIAVLLAVLASGSYVVVALTACALFAAACWEALRLFGQSRPEIGTIVWTALFAYIAFRGQTFNAPVLFGVCAAIWAVRLVPSLKIGLPAIGSVGNRMLTITYGLAIFGCFLAILVFYRSHSAAYLISAMAVVWVADIGAYFSGRAFGSRKLAPSISPGKSWEGVVGGWLAVLLIFVGAAHVPLLANTFSVDIVARFGWVGAILLLTLVVAASVAGDLFESQLKRRVQFKDSSHLLPGHGGVLDRIDALIPAMPLMALAAVLG